MPAPGTRSPFEGQPKVGDFFAPFFTVRFLTGKKEQITEVEKTTGEEDIRAAEVTEIGEIVVTGSKSKIKYSEDEKTSQFRSYTTKLTITNQGGGANMLELTLEPPYEDAMQIIDSRLVQFNSVLAVEWGYVGSDRANSIVSDKHYFVMLQPKLEMRGTDVSITITGQDMFAYGANKREDRRVYDRHAFPTDFSILNYLAAKNKLHLNTSLTAPSSLILRQKPLTPVEPPIIEQNEKDWLFFARLCAMNNADFFTKGDTIYIIDQNVARVQDTSYRLVFFQQPTEARDIPIMSWSTQAIANLFMPAESKQVRSTKADEDKGKVEVEKIDPARDPDQKHLGPRTASGLGEADGRTLKISPTVQLVPNPAFTGKETGKHISSPTGQANQKEFAKQVARRANTLANTNAEVTIPGVPHMVPQQLVRVEGVGKTFSGVYMIMKVVHQLSTSGYECNLTLVREASSGDKVAGEGTRPLTGGQDPKQSPGGEGVTPNTSEGAPPKPKRVS